jgi:sugar phosphate isomerase/epimerase
MSDHPLGAFIICDKGLNARLNAVQKLHIPTAHILAPPKNMRTKEGIEQLQEAFHRAGVRITTVFCGFNGESYSDIPAVQSTVGLVPPLWRNARLDEAKRISDFTKEMGVTSTALHIGFIPENSDLVSYDNIVLAARSLSLHCQANGQLFCLETGQEPADVLAGFIKDVDCSNLAINFDPANMILYGSGEPIPALTLLGSFVKSVHCKDAKWSSQPKIQWGQETPLGEGDVNIKLFLATLKEIGYNGPLTIEREIQGEKQIKDFEKAVDVLLQLRQDVWNKD